MTYHQIKLAYACEPYIQQANNSHLRKIIAQFRTGPHWLHIKTGRLKKLLCSTEFGRFPLQLSWQALAGKYLTRLENMRTERLLKYAFIADRRLKPEVSWRLRLEHQLQGVLIPSPTEEQPHRRQFSLLSAQSQHIQQLSLETSSKRHDLPSNQVGLCL